MYRWVHRQSCCGLQRKRLYLGDSVPLHPRCAMCTLSTDAGAEGAQPAGGNTPLLGNSQPPTVKAQLPMRDLQPRTVVGHRTTSRQLLTVVAGYSVIEWQFMCARCFALQFFFRARPAHLKKAVAIWTSKCRTSFVVFGVRKALMWCGVH